MSKVALSGNALGTGTLTIAAPNTNSDRTLNLPDASGTVQVSGNPISGTTASFSGDVTLGSSVLTTPTGSAPSYTCRAWVNFNGTGTVAIRASGNVSSITDNGVGSYTLNFTSALPDENYAFVFGLSSGNATNPTGAGQLTTKTTTALQFGTWEGANITNDYPQVNVAIFR